MSGGTANILGALGLAISDRIEDTARVVLKRSGETPAALVVIGYGLGPSNNRLRDILGLSHPGTVRLIDRLVADGLVERRRGKDARTLALYLTEDGHTARQSLLQGRMAEMETFLAPLDGEEREVFSNLISKILSNQSLSNLERCRVCRLCDGEACNDCPIPADFRGFTDGKS